MAQRDELIILQRAAEKAVENGWSPNGATILSVDYTLDPSSVILHAQPLHDHDNNDMYFGDYFPLFENEFAIAFWGKELMGDSMFGTLPAWMYHQHRLLFLLQWDAPRQYYEYIFNFL